MEIASGINRYYDTKCDYRQKAEEIVTRYKKLSTAYKFQVSLQLNYYFSYFSLLFVDVLNEDFVDLVDE